MPLGPTKKVSPIFNHLLNIAALILTRFFDRHLTNFEKTTAARIAQDMGYSTKEWSVERHSRAQISRDRVLVLITKGHTQYRQNRDNKAKEVKDLAQKDTRPTSILIYSDGMSEGQYHGGDRGRVDIDSGPPSRRSTRAF